MLLTGQETQVGQQNLEFGAQHVWHMPDVRCQDILPVCIGLERQLQTGLTQMLKSATLPGYAVIHMRTPEGELAPATLASWLSHAGSPHARRLQPMKTYTNQFADALCVGTMQPVQVYALHCTLVLAALISQAHKCAASAVGDFFSVLLLLLCGQAEHAGPVMQSSIATHAHMKVLVVQMSRGLSTRTPPHECGY